MKKIQKIIIIYIFFLSSICLADQSENLQKLKDLYDNNILTEEQYFEGIQKILLNSEEMIRLNDLFQKGLLTEKQFNEAKEKVLQQMAIYNLDVTTNDSPNTSDINKIAPPEGDAELQDYQFNKETWLSNNGLKPEDLSPMLLELSKKSKASVPECTTDFCFTMQPEYAPDEIINKGALINALYRQHPDYKIEPEWLFKDSSYCSDKKGCYRIQKDYSYEIKTDRVKPAEIFNKGALINALYRHDKDFRDSLTYLEGYEGEWDKKNFYRRNTEKLANRINGGYCSDEYGCFQPKVSYTYEPQWIRKVRWENLPDPRSGKIERRGVSYWEKGMGTAWYFDKLFPEEVDPISGCPEGFSKEYCLNSQSAYTKMNKRGFDFKKKMTPDDWLEENDLTIEDVLNKLKGISQTYRFEQEKKISTPLKVEYTDESREIIVAPRWRTTELFPMNDINQNWFINCKKLNPEDNCFNGEIPKFKLSEGTEKIGLFTPDVWLEENGLTAEDVISMLKDYPTTYEIDRETMNDECMRNIYNSEAFVGAGCIADGGGMVTIPLNAKHTYTDEITNTDQLIKSLLFLNPYLFGSDWGHRWNYERRPDSECADSVNWDPKEYEEAGCIKDIIAVNLPKECMGDNPPFYCMLDAGELPPLPDPPTVPIRPGWQILDGTNMLVINDEDPYWQTAEGLIERPPKIDPGIEYPPETLPGADPKIVLDLTPEQDKPPSDPNPPPKLDDPSVLQPVDPGIEGDPIELLSDNPPIASLPGEGHQEPDACVGDANNPCPEGDIEPPPKLSDPTVLQPVDPTVATTEQERTDTEILRRASEGDFSNYVKKELAGAAARLGVTAPREEDFSQNYQTGSSNYQTGSGSSGDGNAGQGTTSDPKIDPGIEYPPETLPGADPKIVPDLTPEQDKPPSDPNPPPKLDDPTVLQPVDPG